MSAEVGGTPWLDFDRPKTVVGVLDSITRFIDTSGEGSLWRGQCRSGWGLSSSLWREFNTFPAGPATKGLRDNWGSREPEIRFAELETLDRANSWGLGLHASGLEVDQHFLATLQHHGVSTRLLDMTGNPFVALWFGCEADAGHDGVLFNVGQNSMEILRTGGGIHRMRSYRNMGSDPAGSWYFDALGRSSKSGFPFVVEPAIRVPRVAAQDGRFLAWAIADDGLDYLGGLSGNHVAIGDMAAENSGVRMTGDQNVRELRVSVLLIPSELKREVRARLEESYSITDNRLFPDIQGFSASMHYGLSRSTGDSGDSKQIQWCRAFADRGVEASPHGSRIVLKVNGLTGVAYMLPIDRVGMQFGPLSESPKDWASPSRGVFLRYPESQVFEQFVGSLTELDTAVKELLVRLPGAGA